MTDEALAKIAVFQRQEVRKQLHNGEWWFVINDVIAALTDSTDPARYLRNLRARDEDLAKLFMEPVEKGASQFETPLSLFFGTPGGKQKLPCWNTEGIFRLVQSIPSKKAEPFKRWLARTGYERIQEIENLRDHMSDLELLFIQLGEASTTEIVRTNDARGLTENKDAAKRGGAVAGTAREQLEQETGRNVINNRNFLPNQGKKELSQ